jgi:glycosyltransferase involved in cell wall biosynthesis
MTSPFVSIVIPVFNDIERLADCLSCLERQTYPCDRFEVLVVDNDSDTSPESLCSRYPNVVCIEEPTPGSYAARNRGIENARGDIFAFTDSDCRPAPDWIESGVAALTAMGSLGLVAGRIDIFFRDPERPTWVELYEEMFAFPQQENAEIRHYGATANVFTTRAVIDTVGPFNAALTSGGDREWGNRVHRAGIAIQYNDDVRTLHPARYDVSDYFSKLRRTVFGHFCLREDDPEKARMFNAVNIARGFIPPVGAIVRMGLLNEQRSLRHRTKVAGFLVLSRYYANLLRLWLAIAPNTYTKQR